jgi:tetratricopeptide (TPR) repeat protein
LELNPSYVPTYSNFGYVLSDIGEPIRAIEIQRKAVELDPLSTFMKAILANRLQEMRRHDEAETLMQSVLADEPDNDYALEQVAYGELASGRMAEAAITYARVHHLRPGDPFSAAMIANIGAYLSAPALAERGLQAARARGADNRWELTALAMVASWQRKPEQIETLARQAGWQGAVWRAQSAVGRQDWAQARAQLQDALRQRNYDPDRSVETGMIPILIELARVEKQLSEDTWRDYAEAARAFLLRFTGQGGVDAARDNAHYLLAQTDALNGDREKALTRMRTAIDTGFLQHWFLDNDPLFAQWRDDPEFVALVTGMRAHAAAEREKLEGVEIEL